jgi:Spy/CpxP family protein refolding chaperone
MFRNFNRGLTIAILSIAAAGVAIPSIVAAQSSPSPTSPSLSKPQRRGGMWAQLNLSGAQKQQLKTIHDTTKQQIEGVLTEEQRAKLAEARQSGDRKGAWKSLNLTADQKQKIGDIRKRSKEQSLAILTPEQRAQLEQMRANRQPK